MKNSISKQIQKEAEIIHEHASAIAKTKATDHTQLLMSLINHSPQIDWDFIEKLIYDLNYNCFYSEASAEKTIQMLQKRHTDLILDVTERFGR